MKFHHRERKMPFAFHSIKPHQIKQNKQRSFGSEIKKEEEKKIVFPEKQKAVTPLHRERKKNQRSEPFKMFKWLQMNASQKKNQKIRKKRNSSSVMAKKKTKISKTTETLK